MTLRPASQLAIAVLVLPLVAATAAAETIKVPSELHATIQSALDDAAPGDTVLVAKGTYDERLVLDGTLDVKLRAAGKVVLQPSTPGTVIQVTEASGVSIDRFTIIGAVGTGILVFDSIDVLVSRCTITDLNATLESSTLEEGVLVQGGSGNRLSRIQVSGALEEAIVALGADGLIIERCTVLDGAGLGMFVDGGSGLVVERNRIAGMAGGGIVFGETSLEGGLGVIESRLSRNKVSGLQDGYRFAGDTLQVEGNSVFLEDYGDGFHLTADCANSNFIGNKVTGGTDTAFRVYGHDNLIEKLKVKDARNSGIQVEGANNDLLKCLVSKPWGTGIRIEPEATFTRLEQCTVRGAGAFYESSDGFQVVSDGHSFVRCRASGSSGFDLNDESGDVGDQNVFTDCKFVTTND